jgi:anion-transporting  ArsA/GET3 family ATPase
MIPGLDMFTTLGSLRRYTAGYQVVVYDGPGASDVLRLVGSPSRLQWYLQRGRTALQRMELGRVALPLVRGSNRNRASNPHETLLLGCSCVDLPLPSP